LESALDDHLVSVASDVASRLEDPEADPPMLVQRFSSPSQLVEVRDAAGNVVVGAPLLNGEPLPGVRFVLAEQRQTFRTAPYERGRLRVLVYPVEADGELIGYVNVASPIPGLGEQVRELVLIILLLGVMALG